MKLLELEIKNVRGIKHVKLVPNGKNFVIWGPNGSGKSAVIDALDFLLTGRISRLTGKGTGGISLSKHGPHIDCKPKDAVVKAKVGISGLSDPVEISRCLAKPDELVYGESLKPVLEPIINLAHRGQHILTRREILKYIAAEASTRAQGIQELLNVSEIEDIRKTLVNVQNTFDKNLKAAKNGVSTAKTQVSTTINSKTFQEEAVLEIINENRLVLGAQPISKLGSSVLKNELKPPTSTPAKKSVNPVLIENYVASIKGVLTEESHSKIAEDDLQLRTLVKEVRAKPELLKALSHQRLIELGLNLIDDTGKCPLCNVEWEPDKLKDYLTKRLADAKTASEYKDKINQLAVSLNEPISRITASLKEILEVLSLLGLEEDASAYQAWYNDSQTFSSILSNPLEAFPDDRFDSAKIKQAFSPENASDMLNRLLIAVKNNQPPMTKELVAWTMLTRIEENLKALEIANQKLSQAELSYKKATILLGSFLKARDEILGKLYDGIKDRFVELYRNLHKLDEENFEAKIEPEEAALNLEVDFYQRGTHPPHALHSEGHQDSMGLCLYLALAEYLAEGLIDLVILDDVVMSVDAEHRREICNVLTTFFPNRQFMVTTHDKTWASQLRNQSVVDSKGAVEFYNWHIDTGPKVNYEVDMWERIRNHLEKENVSDAASLLRRGSEQFFGQVCDSLRASVVYRMNGKWELGDYLPAAIGKYKDYLKKAKAAAQSWGDNELHSALQEVDSTASQVFKRLNIEQWAVNPNVHYTSWANFTKADFTPVVEVFQDLFGLFKCNRCGDVLTVLTKGVKPESVKCSCGQVNWNLVAKK